MTIDKQHLVIILVVCLATLAGCSGKDEPEQIALFCARLHQVNAGAIDTSKLKELEGHARIIEALLEASPPSLEEDLERRVTEMGQLWHVGDELTFDR